jgi:hypothetical protein
VLEHPQPSHKKNGTLANSFAFMGTRRNEKMQKMKPMSGLAVFFMLAGMIFPLQAQTKGSWIHVEVREGKADPELVKVNLPLSMLETALDMVKDKDIQGGHLKLHSHDLSVAEMRQLWNEVKNAGNAEFVTVQKAHETVRVARDGNYLLVKVDEAKGKNSKVDLKVPLAVVDALFNGTGDELNVKAALSAMQKSGVGDILTVHDDDTQVRLWIE